MVSTIQLREFSRLDYHDPREVLIRLRQLECEVAISDLTDNLKRLRGSKLRKYREFREAALFCLGMSERIGYRIYFSATEADDYDFVAAWKADGEEFFAKVELKEFVPEGLAPNLSFQELVNGLEKYGDDENLVVAIHSHRNFRPEQIDFNRVMGLGSIWCFGAVSEDQYRWALWGDLLLQVDDADKFSTFQYPQCWSIGTHEWDLELI